MKHALTPPQCHHLEREIVLSALAAVLQHWAAAIGVETALTVKQVIDHATDTIPAAAERDRRSHQCVYG
jgi:hypothetical protein